MGIESDVGALDELAQITNANSGVVSSDNSVLVFGPDVISNSHSEVLPNVVEMDTELSNIAHI